MAEKTTSQKFDELIEKRTGKTIEELKNSPLNSEIEIDFDIVKIGGGFFHRKNIITAKDMEDINKAFDERCADIERKIKRKKFRSK